MSLSCLLLAVLCQASSVQAQSSSLQFWPEIDNFIRLGKPTRLYVPLSSTRTGINDPAQNGTAGIYFDFFTPALGRLRKAIQPDPARRGRLLLRAGYAYSAPGDGSPATNTFTVEGTGRAHLPGQVLLSERNKFDFNYTDGDYDPRYRNRVRLERDIQLGSPTLTPYGYVEFFYDFADKKWFRTRLVGGLEFHLWERVVPEIYYQADNNYTSDNVDGIGVVVSLYYR